MSRILNPFVTQNLLNRIVQNIQYLLQSGDSNAAALLANLPTVSVRMAMAIAGVLPVLVIYPFGNDYLKKRLRLRCPVNIRRFNDLIRNTFAVGYNTACLCHFQERTSGKRRSYFLRFLYYAV